MVQRIEHKFDDNGIEMKFCGHKNHKAFVPVSEFGKAKTWDNLRPTCKKCIKGDNDNADDEDKEKRKKRSREYYHNHKKNSDDDNIVETTIENPDITNTDIVNTVTTDNTSQKEKSHKKERKEHRFENCIELKHCTSCENKGTEAWRTLDYFNKEEKRWDKLANWCKDCFNEKRNETRPSRAKKDKKENPSKSSNTGSSHKKEHKTINDEEFKWCSKCSAWKYLQSFGGNITKWDGLETYCKSCYNEKQQESRLSRLESNFNKIIDVLNGKL